MRDVSRFAPAVILAGGVLMLSGIREQKKTPPLAPISTLSIDVPGFATRDTVIADAERKVAGMSDYVLRFFQRGPTLDDGFSVYVGYYDYQVQGKTIHSPKNCLPGAGWEPLNASVQPVVVDGVAHPVNRYVLANQGHQALVYYWYQGRGRTEANEYRVKLNLLRDAALYGRTEEALVRIVVPLDAATLRSAGTQATYRSADSLATSVAQKLIPAVFRVVPSSPVS